MIQITRPAMFVSTLGIGLGGLWAYTVLDWGGYWAWDPVETGSMLPWLVLVIMLHLRTRPGKNSCRPLGWFVFSCWHDGVICNACDQSRRGLGK